MSAPAAEQAPADTARERWMACCFAVGAACFLIGPIPYYTTLVGEAADSITFFAGSILFTAGGALQTWLAHTDRHLSTHGRSLLAAAAVQSVGTILFNVTTYRAMHTAIANPHYNRLVWSPDALGSICFLISGAIAYRASPRRGRLGWRPVRTLPGWWEPGINLIGCILFGISAIASYVVPATGSPLDLGAASFSTAAGAACFLACALATLLTGRTMKSPGRHRLVWIEHALAREIRAL